mmetsp:Transcript_43058/g.88631  ORF Transcript_43058/g.88631 Transcript_43058/m.88631 type:complete len:357 (-) Transcript_43058:508-1578(-)
MSISVLRCCNCTFQQGCQPINSAVSACRTRSLEPRIHGRYLRRFLLNLLQTCTKSFACGCMRRRYPGSGSRYLCRRDSQVSILVLGQCCIHVDGAAGALPASLALAHACLALAMATASSRTHQSKLFVLFGDLLKLQLQRRRLSRGGTHQLTCLSTKTFLTFALAEPAHTFAGAGRVCAASRVCLREVESRLGKRLKVVLTCRSRPTVVADACTLTAVSAVVAVQRTSLLLLHLTLPCKLLFLSCQTSAEDRGQRKGLFQELRAILSTELLRAQTSTYMALSVSAAVIEAPLMLTRLAIVALSAETLASQANALAAAVQAAAPGSSCRRCLQSTEFVTRDCILLATGLSDGTCKCF